MTRTTTRRCRRRGDHLGVDDSCVPLRDVDDAVGVLRGCGDEHGRGGAGPERADEQVVAVAAGVAGVDDVRAGHTEVHAERGSGEPTEHDEPDGEHGAGRRSDCAVHRRQRLSAVMSGSASPS